MAGTLIDVVIKDLKFLGEAQDDAPKPEVAIPRIEQVEVASWWQRLCSCLPFDN